ncbi:MAG: DUF262 domain-containing protein [Eubacteriales bacterium]|nr:DUF262 domain-containing protein [Eubacteriales bacterium]
MSTTLHSFIDIFESEFETDTTPVKVCKIAIPIIQRDYAQGRENPDVTRIRNRFLDSLYDAVTAHPITLDFVYGDIDEKGIMTPLDGQQRLTTLFLLHWYAVKKEKIPENEWEFLYNFSYETRYSARYFCTELVNFNPDFSESLKSQIIDQSWFPLDWKKDPTISSMLTMLDAIADRFAAADNLWNSLKNGAITFYFLPIRDMGLTDELYIKMNSRGKPLTQFEHFKAELERCIRASDNKVADRILNKIDLAWTDLLWNYRDSGNGIEDDNITDDEFLRYFKFICDVLCYNKGESPQGKSSDEFDLLQTYFAKQNEDAMSNILALESYFDCWCSIPDFKDPSSFLKSVMSSSHQPGKITVDSGRYKLDIFEDCLHSYNDKRQFPLNRFVLLYAVTVYLRNSMKVQYSDFVRRIRIVNNLIQNSVDEVSDRIDRNRIPAVLAQTEAIILTGKIDNSIENSFNLNQITEEKAKIEYLKDNPDQSEKLFSLEDHPMLKGQISILGIENLSLSDRFVSLFNCDWDKIDRALMATGNYGQQERNGWRYQYASKSMQLAWDELFHKSANSGFDNTKNILVALLSGNTIFNDDILDSIVDKYLSDCESKGTYPWRYYYIKYNVFRPGSYGKLSNGKPSEEPYLYSVMQTKTQWSQNTYMPYLKAADNEHLSRDDMGQKLVYSDTYIICENAAYIVKNTMDDSVVDTITIMQNESGTDTEDRIERLQIYLNSNTKRN